MQKDAEVQAFYYEGEFDNIEKNISAGDYLLIEFCHNDDASKEYKTMFNRLTPLGEPDSDGRFPIIPGEAMPRIIYRLNILMH